MGIERFEAANGKDEGESFCRVRTRRVKFAAVRWLRRVGVRVLVRPAMVTVRMGFREDEESAGEGLGMGLWRWGFQVGRMCIVAFDGRLLKDLACPGPCDCEATVDNGQRTVNDGQ